MNEEKNSKVESFNLDHTKVKAPFVRKCTVYTGKLGDKVTKFDLRFTQPNEDEMKSDGIHTLEHLLATYLREYTDNIIDLSPMGCRTGFYLLMAGDYTSKDIVPLMIRMFEFIRDFEGEIPGASAKDCGNYLDMNHGMAKYLADRYLKNVLYDIKPERLTYPE